MSLDPVTADLIFTALTAALLLAGGVFALRLLPWTDAEIDAADRAARSEARRLSGLHLSPAIIGRRDRPNIA